MILGQQRHAPALAQIPPEILGASVLVAHNLLVHRASTAGRRRPQSRFRDYSDGVRLAGIGIAAALPSTFEGNPASNIVQEPGRARLMAALGITGTAAGAGLFFSYLRLRSRSVAAAVLTHAAINIVPFGDRQSPVDRGLPHTTSIRSRTR